MAEPHNPLRLRRSDLAALIVGTVTIGYTAFALIQPFSNHDTTLDAAHREPPTISTSDTSDTSDTSGAPDALGAQGGPAGPTTGPAGQPPSTRATPSTRSAGRSTASTPPTGRTGSGRPSPGRSAQRPGTTTRPGMPTTATTTARTTGWTTTGPADPPPAAAPRPPAGSPPGESSTTVTRTIITSRPATTSTRPATTPSRPATSTAPTLPPVPVACSHPSLLAAFVTFVNQSSTSLRLEYSSVTCQRHPYTTLPPGGRVSVASWIGHAWILVDPATGRVVGSHVIAPGERTIAMP